VVASNGVNRPHTPMAGPAQLDCAGGLGECPFNPGPPRVLRRELLSLWNKPQGVVRDPPPLAQHQAVLLAVGAHQVDIAGAEPAGAAQGLAVNCDAVQPAGGALPPGRSGLLGLGPEEILQSDNIHARTRRLIVARLGPHRRVKPRRRRRARRVCCPQRVTARWVLAPQRRATTMSRSSAPGMALPPSGARIGHPAEDVGQRRDEQRVDEDLPRE
jgi:hypothetical protein